MDGEHFTFSAARFLPSDSESPIVRNLFAPPHPQSLCSICIRHVARSTTDPIRSSFQWSTADDWVISGFNLGDVHVAHSTDGWVHIVKVALP